MLPPVENWSDYSSFLQHGAPTYWSAFVIYKMAPSCYVSFALVAVT